jgi:CRISPR-associated protein Cas5d
LRAAGPLACFTEPAFKVERVSYPVMTPSAARGILEAVLWKPAICWHVQRLQVLKPIRFVAFRRNEVNSKAPDPRRGPVRAFFADEDRAQRNTVALRDVDYLIEAQFTLTERAGAKDNVPKFVDMFSRRLEKGQHFHQPYLGCREFAADVSSAEGAPTPIAETRDFGLMLWDIAFSGDGNRPLLYEARMVNGVIEVPERGLTAGSAA